MSEIELFDKEQAKIKLNYAVQHELSEKIAGTLKKIVVNSEDTCKIAKNTLGNAAELVEKIEKARKDLIKPYQDVIDLINEVSKDILDPMKTAIESTNKNVTLWQNTSIEKAKADFNTEIEKIEKDSELQREKFELVKRTAAQLLARIFGGSFKSKDGTEKIIACPTFISEVEEQISFIENKMPGNEAFSPFETIADSLRSTILTSASLLIEHLERKANASGVIELGQIDQQISVLRANTELKFNEDIKACSSFLKKSISSMNKSAELKFKEVAKGTRKTIRWGIADINLVPQEYLSLDEEKIKEFIKDKKVKEDIEGGGQPISGINFFITRKAIINKT